MAKLYLVRRSMETYIGPMDISALKQAYRRMEFGLQDEVAASCGEWLAFDDVSALKRRYPELAKVVTEELLGGWGISEHDQKRIIESTKRRYKKKKSSKKKGPGIVVPLLIFLLIGVAVAIFLAKNTKFSGRFFERQRTPGPELVKNLLATGQSQKFDQSLQRLLPTILPKVTTSRKSYNEWIPYLRYYAYRQDGSITGVNAKLMRGMGQFAAPQDCSLQAWIDRWRQIDYDTLAAINLGSGQYPASEWAKVLFWDPHWVSRRKTSGWIEPRNYYEGCLWMARRAIPLVNKTLPPDNQVPLIVAQRMDFLVSMINGQRIGSRPEEGIIGYITCLENAASTTMVENCVLPESEMTEEWKQHLTMVKARVETRLFLEGKVVLTDDEIAKLSQLHKVQEPRDSFTSFNYQPEIKHMVSIMLNNGSVKEADKRMKYEFPEVQFSD